MHTTIWQIIEKTWSFTKPKVHNVSQRHRRRTEPRP